MADHTRTARRTRPTSVLEEIRQTKPFRSLAEHAMVTLLRTAEVVRWPFHDALGPRGLTLQQYNVLRILRGAGAGGLPTLDVAERMIERTPGVSRLIDRLVAKGLVRRERGDQDRRQVLCVITDDGLALLRELDRTITALDRRAFAGLSEREVRTLIALMDRVRHAAAP